MKEIFSPKYHEMTYCESFFSPPFLDVIVFVLQTKFEYPLNNFHFVLTPNLLNIWEKLSEFISSWTRYHLKIQNKSSIVKRLSRRRGCCFSIMPRRKAFFSPQPKYYTCSLHSLHTLPWRKTKRKKERKKALFTLRHLYSFTSIWWFTHVECYLFITTIKSISICHHHYDVQQKSFLENIIQTK